MYKMSLALVAVLLSGCSYRVGDCTLMSTKNIYCKNVDLTKLEQKQGVEGKDIRFWGIGSNIKDAADEAFERAGGNLMIDPVVHYEFVPLICGGYVVKGTVVKVPYSNNSKTETKSQKEDNLEISAYHVSTDPASGEMKFEPIYKNEKHGQ
jgi:hypothetical protein